MLPENNQKFKSIVFNCYGESASQLFCTDATLCEDGTKPIINLYGTESCKEIEVDACTQWNNIAVTADGMKITQTADGTLGVFDLTLKNGASFVYPFDGMELSGSLNMDGADAKLDAVDNYEISGDVSLTNGASLNVETTLTVGGQFSAEEGCAITMEPDANAVLNSVADDSLCSVIYNGKAADAERSGISIRSVSETEGRHFTDAATSDEQTIVKRFEDNTWYYGTQENTGDIYLRSNGDDTYDGTTAAKSVATLKRALEIAADSEETGKNIVLCGRYTFENTDSNQISNEVLEKLKTKQITITQKNSGSTTYHGVLTVNSGFQIPCALRLQTITLNFHADTQAAPELYACGFGLIVDEAVTVKSNTIAPVLYGGAKDTDCENTNLYVYSGTWSRIYGGGKNGAVLGNACITLGSSEKQIAPSVWAGSEDSNYTSNTYAVIGGGQYGNVAGASTINLNYGTEYNYVIGGGVNGDSASTCINVNNEEVSAARLYGGGVNGSVTGNAEVNVLGGSFKRVYGAGIMQSSSVGSTAVTIGKGKTTVTQFIRGSGDRGKVDGTASLTINDGAEIPSSCSLAAGGYMGGAACSVLTINGGNIACNSFAGGYGEFKAGSTTEINTDVGYVSASKLYINGGTISGNLFAGGNMGYVGSGKHQNTDCSTVQISGGRVDGNIYGGCNIAATYGNVVLNLKGGTVNGKVFGGGKGSTSIGAVVTGSTEVIVDAPVATGGIYGGCDANGSVENTKLECNTIPGCDVFGGGYGEQTSVTGSTAITLNASDASNDYAVYGGGELGKVNTTEITAQKWTGNIYGGGSKAETTSTASVTVNGTVDGSVFGGGKGALKSESTVMRFLLRVFTDGDLIDAHTVSTNVTVAGTVNGDVFGGGEYATVGDGGDASVTSVAICGTVNGRVYGGGKGEAGKSYAAINGSTLVTLEKNGSVLENAELAGTGMVFGGGQNAPVNGSTQVQVHDGAYTSVFGGNDASGAISGMAQAAMSGGEVTQIYAAGQKADAKTAAVTVTGGTAQLVYGGGNEATVTDETKVTVTGGKVDTVFAGNNRAAMAIQPTLELAGHINAVYCGGNEGVMTAPLQYTFDFPDVEIDELFAGCNNTGEIQTSDTVLTLVSGSYSSVYGGNNQTGNMLHTSVVVEESEENALTIQELYGGGNCADAVNTKVTVNAYAEKSGKTFTVYGGGNEATVSDSVQLVLGDESHQKTPQVDAMFCGNNAAEMAIIPALQLESGEIKEFYGGGNKGAMTGDDGVAYTFDSDGLTIDTIYGGGNEAGVTNGVVLNIAKGNYTDIYGGSNEKGTVSTVAVNIRGDVGTESKTGAVFGGGHGEDTVVQDAAVNLLSGTINGNVYGGSGYGSVENTVVTAEPDSDGAVVVLGNVYGAGYGETSAVTNASVVIDLPLSISTQTGEGNLTVTETAKSVESVSGESHASAKWNEAAGSYISGSVFGGGDMGQVGSGHINASSNTAVIDTTGSTSVQVRSGDIKGSVFGGGNGQPASGTVYTLYMGTVFGSSEVQITGGYIEGSIFGCGQQSRTYSAENGIASNVGITAVDGKPVVIGGSVFGGGNKGNGSNQNASVATVYGDTHVKLSGEAGKYTQIYMLSTESSGGGIYGDGNLCLVSGKKYVELENFSCGVRTDLLKTFYSLQRADVVTLKGSRVVLLGAVDLVADQADDTQYSVNRVGQLNLKDSSTIKVTKTVNLLSELTSDEQPDRQFVDRGNNTGNAGISGNDYTGHGGSAPKAPLTAEENQAYIADYQAYIEGKSLPNDTFRSINVVCVANGGYLEVKKSAEEYGAVTGLFTLQLVNANPGEGGGFVYASIQGKQSGDDYITGNFVCVTPDSSGNGFMTVFHDVGGSYDEGKYEYYLWYLKGNKYSYDVNLTGYIGTQDTEFEKTLSVSADRDQYYVLLDLERSRTVTGFEDSMLQNVWTGSDADRTSSRIAIEVQLLTNERSGSGIDTNTQNIGFIGYQTEDNTPDGTASLDENGQRVWGIWRSVNNAWSFQPCKGDKNSFAVTAADALAKLDENVVGAQLKFILHKGTGMTTEFRNLPFELKIAEVAKSDFEGPNKIQTDSCILLTANLNVSAIRLVPSQAAYLGAGKLYGGVSSDSVVNITDESAFTMQFITKYIPSAFGTSSADAIQETLCTSYDTIYLVDANGVGYTLDAKSEALTPTYVTNQNDNTVQGYTIAESNGAYTVTYLDASGSALTDEDGNVRSYSCTAIRQSSGFELPAGTTITLIASIDEATPSYWYYYCEKSTGEVPLGEFTMMNRSENSTGDSIYDVISSNSSSRITENMIFVLDFSNVPERNWPSVTEGTAILSHTYRTGSQSYADIMDFVSEETLQNGGTAYTHEAAKETGEFRINRATDGIDQFSVLRDDAQESDDALTFDLIITPDNTATNTRYEERQYAVILSLQDKNGTQIAFPEGTEFMYQGEQLHLGAGNDYVIVPVGTVGTHTVRMRTTLETLAAGDYQLHGELYATSAQGYYNSIHIVHSGDINDAAFTVAEQPVYALKVTENSQRAKNHIAAAGESFNFSITAQGGSKPVSVSVYRMEENAYKKAAIAEVLNAAEIPAGSQVSWTPSIAASAQPGIYRLEFTYYDKTEYWDFVVKAAN